MRRMSPLNGKPGIRPIPAIITCFPQALEKIKHDAPHQGLIDRAEEIKRAGRHGQDPLRAFAGLLCCIGDDKIAVLLPVQYSQFLFFVLSGRLSAAVSNVEGDEIIHIFCSPWEVAFFLYRPSFSTVAALSSRAVLRISVERCRVAIGGDPEMLGFLGKTWQKSWSPPRRAAPGAFWPLSRRGWPPASWQWRVAGCIGSTYCCWRTTLGSATVTFGACCTTLCSRAFWSASPRAFTGQGPGGLAALRRGRRKNRLRIVPHTARWFRAGKPDSRKVRRRQFLDARIALPNILFVPLL